MIDSAPILPPNGAAGLNLAGSDGDGGITWQGLTIEQAEAINCQGVSQADELRGTAPPISTCSGTTARSTRHTH